MSKRAIFDVLVAGTSITTALAPVFTGLSITDNAGTHSDTATIEVDDTDGRIILPQPQAPVVIRLGWIGDGTREVFRGTVDEVRSSGSRGGGRSLSISAKGVDTTGKAKEGQQRHFDGQTVEAILTAAGAPAGITQIDVDPALAGVVFPYLDMRDESFLHLGERLARELGAGFRVHGERAVLAKRAGGYTPSVTAAWGVNLQSWSMTPAIGRGRFVQTRARAYDMRRAAEVIEEAATGTTLSSAALARRELLPDKEAAKRAAESDAAAAKEKAGGGSVVIEGTTEAVPDGRCVIVGARPGIDGTYTIKTVTHSLSRGGGWTTSLELAEPQAGAGTDTRARGA
jgi:phage protein D